MKDIDQACHDKLLVILHTACSEMRRFIQIGAHQRAYELADAIQFIPEQMLHWRPECWEAIRETLGAYQATYAGTGFDYLSLLDMADTSFASCYVAVDSMPVEKSAMQDAPS